MSCEQWCTSPCSALNGGDTIVSECGGCSEATSACHPGASDFGLSPSPPSVAEFGTKTMATLQDDESPSVAMSRAAQQLSEALSSKYMRDHPLHDHIQFESTAPPESMFGEASSCAPDSFGWTALQYAALFGSADLVRRLMVSSAQSANAASSEAVYCTGLSPVELAAASGNAPALSSLLRASQQCVDAPGADAAEALASSEGRQAAPLQTARLLAAGRGHTRIVRLLDAEVERSQHACDAEAEAERASASSGSSKPSDGVPIPGRPEPAGTHRRAEKKRAQERTQRWSMDAEELKRDFAAVHRRAYTESTPLAVRGLARPWSARLRGWTLQDYDNAWGNVSVRLAMSPNPIINQVVADEGGAAAVRSNAVVDASFGEFVRLVPAHGRPDYVAVSQSEMRSFSQIGLPQQPPGLRFASSTLIMRSLWAQVPPLISSLHADSLDAMVLQLSGTKRWTLVNPEGAYRKWPLYPAYLRHWDLARVSPGKYEARPAWNTMHRGGDGSASAPKVASHFPLVNVTHPDYVSHPLFAHAEVREIELREGDALLVPACWFHQVESHLSGSALNVAATYGWLPSRDSIAKREQLHTHFFGHFHIDCASRPQPSACFIPSLLPMPATIVRP